MTEKTFTPTDEQANAIHAQDAKYGIRAGAGTGKTSVLVEKYLQLTKEGTPADQILVITFTRKAAAEIKSRIVSRLRQLGFYDQAQLAETGPIQTIDSFCERILREHAIEAGVDPEFQLEAEGMSEGRSRNFIREALTDMALEDDAVCSLANQLPVGGLDEQIKHNSNLMQKIETILDAMRSSIASRETLDELFRNQAAYNKVAHRALLEQTAGSLHPPQSVDELFGSNWTWEVACRQIIEDKRLRGVSRWCNEVRLPQIEQRLTEDAAVGRVSCEAWRRLEREMQSSQVFDFSEVAARALRLLRNKDSARQKIARSISVALVDEAQDVNPLQFALIESLLLRQLTYVGDPQQSIYLFRHADPNLFRARLGEIPTFDLTTNHRSIPGILTFVERVFATHWGEDFQVLNPSEPPMQDGPFSETSFSGVEAWTINSKWPNAAAHGIGQLIAEGHSPREIAALCLNSSQIKLLSDALRSKEIPHRVVSGLARYYSRMTVRDIAVAIEALSNPRDDFSLLCLLHSPIVGVSFDCIASLALQPPVIDRLDDLDSLDSEDAAKIVDFKNWFCDLTLKIDRMSAWEVIHRLFCDSPILVNLAQTSMADQHLANVRKLLSLACQQSSVSPLEFARRTRSIQQVSHREGDADTFDDDSNVVTLMTIHKAKGLEFPVVVIPILNARSPARSSIFDCETGLVATRSPQESNDLFANLASTQERKEQEDRDRVFYVALTRARTKLCLVIDESARKHSRLTELVVRSAGTRERPAPGISYRVFE